MIQKIKDNKTLLAIVIPRDYTSKGIKFFSNKSYSQQLGYMKRPQGYTVQKHIHEINKREIFHTQEVLIVRKGLIIVSIYSLKKKFIDDVMLTPGDIIHLIDGGHSIFFHTEAEVIEVKQGPYGDDKDKRRF